MRGLADDGAAGGQSDLAVTLTGHWARDTICLRLFEVNTVVKTDEQVHISGSSYGCRVACGVCRTAIRNSCY